MLPTAKIAPSCSLKTAASIRGDLRVPSAWQRSNNATACAKASPSSYVGLPPSPRAAHRMLPRRHAVWSRLRPPALLTWLRTWPQTAFLLLVVVCTYIGGLSASTQLTDVLLVFANVPLATAVAQQRYVDTSKALQHASRCVAEQSLLQSAALRAALAKHEQRVRDTVSANAAALHQLDDRVMTCSELLFHAVNTSADPSVKQCVAAAVVANDNDNIDTVTTVNTNELVNRMHITLLANRLFELPNATTAIDMDAAIDDLERSVAAVFEATAAASSVTSTTDDDASLALALAPPPINAVDALDALRAKLQQLLVPFNSTVATALLNATVVDEWRALESRIDALQTESVELQQLLAQHERSAAEVTRETLELAASGVADSIALLRLRSAADAQVTSAAQALTRRAVDAQLRALVAPLAATANAQPDVRISHDLVLDGDDPAVELVRREVALVQRRDELASQQNGSGYSDNNSTGEMPPWLLSIGVTRSEVRSAFAVGLALGRLAKDVVFALDFGRIGLAVLEVAVTLRTDSYTLIAPVDIRGISTIQTLRDAWTLLQCRHDANSVCYFVATQASALLQIAAAYVVWIGAGVAGTSALVLWRHDHARVCDAGGEYTESHTLVQTLVSIALPIRATVWDPERELAAQSAVATQLTHHALWRIANATAVVWENQTAALAHLEVDERTLANLTRLFDTCTFEHASDNGSIGTADACASLDASSSSRCALLTPAPPLPTELLDAFSATAQTESLQHCAPTNVRALHRAQACAAERVLYLFVASWWLLCVVWSVARRLTRSAVTAYAMSAWRGLSANRLELVGFCYEDGTVYAPETLARAVHDRLRDVRLLLALRGVSALLTVTATAVIWHLVLHNVV